ncbi:MAG: ribosome maturation factor RimM [Burkholderiaceae bacterium]
MSRDQAPADEPPVELGWVLGAYGVRGQLRVRVPSGRDSILPTLAAVSLVAADRVLHGVVVRAARWQGEHLLLSLDGIADRDAAAAWRGAAICARRSDFPPLAADEFYWIDLIGCTVVNRAGDILGRVEAVDEHGSAPFMMVRDAANGAPEHLIPLVDAYLLEIVLAERRVLVDWRADWS